MANPTLRTLSPALLSLFVASQAIAADVLDRDGAEPVLDGTLHEDEAADVRVLVTESLARLAA